MVPITAPYGSWKSPITAEMVASGTIRLASPAIMENGDCCWLELRPEEAGRTVLVCRTEDGNTIDVTPPPFNVRTRVHEYGGGAYLVENEEVYFSNYADQRLYRQQPGLEPQPITPAIDVRYADGVFDHLSQRLICVCEEHTAGQHEPANYLASVDINTTGAPQKLVSGNDFYSSPRISPDATRLAWLTWNHPNMPWDGCELWLGDIGRNGLISSPRRVAGSRDESISQPRFAPDGSLYFISDRNGWWNLYRENEDGKIECLWAKNAEFAEPDWVFGNATYAFLQGDAVICTYSERGTWKLAVINTRSSEIQPVEMPYTSISSVTAAGNHVLFIGASPSQPPSIVRLDLETGKTDVLRRSIEIALEEGYLSIPEAIEFPTENGLTAHAFYYPPANRDYNAPAEEKPPLLVASHGGPTGAANASLNMSLQYWTSRGFAVVDVDYSGSSGYGRDYRKRLENNWGIVDVDDCVNAARFLVDRGVADGRRLAIRGSSAGGYTTLAALTFRDVFKAGASYYGVSDLEALVKDTHKFESRYLDGLVGPYPAARDTYVERSPLHHVEKLSCPVIFFQGSEDKVVPPDQSERMVDVLRTRGVPVAYLLFDGEQHGFRQAQHIRRALEAELYFYAQIFGFLANDAIQPVPIENLS